MADNLTALANRVRQAQERCPHWDYEDDNDGAHPCCQELWEAESVYRAARRKSEKV